MLYTRKGDRGTTQDPRTFECAQKNDPLFEALGCLDELNSWVGLCRVKSLEEVRVTSYELRVPDVLHTIQQHLFIIQAELAGKKRLEEGAVRELESWIAAIEKELPLIRSFCIPGGTELSAMLDVARVVARRAERSIIALHERSHLSSSLLAYLNRLSSLLFALARLVNHRAGVKEEKPTYE
jgi:cob(I)alamin adenosyltransferase